MCGVGANKDQVNGWFYLVASISIYSYITFWLLVLPFIEKDFHVIHSLFPPAEYAIKTMVVVGIFVLTIASTFMGVVMLRSHAATVEAQKSNSAARKRT
ncbi:dolichylphosphate mannosyltransferase polypeptide 2, putative [Acanthamoeba castellanii str. Neff]|uniref:Dolichol phosphate-mannose biosynthesis regulatory protein n=1 Tax=Acanthamoeba castellanii (strain ATCC 30010 / Neff) TaxID=1257118 RepID=L8GJY5_ACACF|nr:dolichylphosphate mannosyltransferase polypeptide 2, putative [Acanthamoeba castellanii str. Neff]ELR13347.1 dolichylphosphate mannosyltransferase polypeptide 2, putative [Acanthamoeba castellanii str. Neff]